MASNTQAWIALGIIALVISAFVNTLSIIRNADSIATNAESIKAHVWEADHDLR